MKMIRPVGQIGRADIPVRSFTPARTACEWCVANGRGTRRCAASKDTGSSVNTVRHIHDKRSIIYVTSMTRVLCHIHDTRFLSHS